MAGAIDRSADYLTGLDSSETKRLSAEYAARSTAVRSAQSSHLDVAYGGDPAERFDLFLPARGKARTVVLFFHGGWWKMGSKDERAFIAPALNESGVGFASIEYALAPKTSIGDIATGAVRAVAQASRYVEALLGEAPRLILAGNSAGGHLATYAASNATGSPNIVGLVSVSGLYDLAPLRQTYINEWLNLDDSTTLQFSPIHRLPERRFRIVLAVGGREAAGFHQQMKSYQKECRNRDIHPTCLTIPDRDHFSIIGDLATVQSPLARALLDLALDHN